MATVTRLMTERQLQTHVTTAAKQLGVNGGPVSNTNPPLRVPGPLEARLWPKIAKGQEGECWRWLGFIDKAGYGRLQGVGRKSTVLYVHRLVFELTRGPIPAGKELDHLCRNRWCCNPVHLDPVIHRINALRGGAPAILLHLKGVCKNGHSADQSYRRKSTGRIVYCRLCRNAKRRQFAGSGD